MRISRMIVLGIAITCTAACHSGPDLIKEKKMQNHSEVASLARKEVKVLVNHHPTAMKVAIIGINTDRELSVHHHHQFDPSDSYRERAHDMNHANDFYNYTACKALDSTFDSLVTTLDEVGLQAVPIDDKLEFDEINVYEESLGGSLPFCVATKARISMYRLYGIRMLSQFGRRELTPDMQTKMRNLMDKVGVDGFLVAYLNADDMAVRRSSLGLLARQPDGSVKAVWQGELIEKRIKFEAVADKPSSDDDRMKNAARVYHHSFELLAAKLAADSKH